MVVTGVVPPGTGVYAPATRSTDSGSASPIIRPDDTLTPKSITVVPGLIISPVSRPGCPAARTTMSDVPVSASRGTVRLWQRVTVASRAVRRAAIGLPTTLPRPTTTAREPATGI